ncbi:MerR family transcriptional regulator [Paractinoplanes lichenicola]|uniref:MerR family transcriptional regulator n=1 Tax=Paractinoplanes lichenicola TaxID=2802976 RepID=A0ABS1W4H8_9ACTN|nr:MerR family transcriptional regulator [Actinoplanes lichenicola]MBL7261641.1 MerR family transcriptional regulator [Actinoplanes lichenicola]
MWTLDELVERVREALEAEYPGAPNGRVRDVPDRRAIRWYSTIGLVDKPLGMRGRTALYGPRHLQQLVAVKRRQAEGLTIAQIQAELTAISPARLTEIALVPSNLMVTIDEEAFGQQHTQRSRFWADRPAEAPAPPADLPLPAPPSPVRSVAASQAFTGLALGGGVLLLVPAAVSDADRDAVAEAAAPLLDLLTARGLTTADGLIDGSPS